MDAASDRVGAASDWFARMRGPGAEAARGAFEAWRADPANAAAYAQIEAIWSAAGASRIGRGAAERAIAPAWRRSALAAAAVVAAIAAGLLVADYARSPQRREEVTYASPPGATRTIDLADGSRVTLDLGSSITTDFGGTERRVRLLAGRGRFAVAHDAARPFVVIAGDRAVVARGTVFDVRLTGGMAVTLIEGAVDLEIRGKRTRPRHLARLRPGETARFSRPDAPPRIVLAGPEPWPQSMLTGDGMRLADVVAAANRQGMPRIVLADPALGALRVSGGYQPGRTQALAQTLAAALDLQAVTRSDGVIVLARTARTPAAE